jgi:hypothetical protein
VSGEVKCQWGKVTSYGPCSELGASDKDGYRIVYPPINGEPDVEEPFCFAHALKFIERAERANAIQLPVMEKITEEAG